MCIIAMPILNQFTALEKCVTFVVFDFVREKHTAKKNRKWLQTVPHYTLVGRGLSFAKFLVPHLYSGVYWFYFFVGSVFVSFTAFRILHQKHPFGNQSMGIQFYPTEKKKKITEKMIHKVKKFHGTKRKKPNNWKKGRDGEK